MDLFNSIVSDDMSKWETLPESILDDIGTLASRHEEVWVVRKIGKGVTGCINYEPMCIHKCEVQKGEAIYADSFDAWEASFDLQMVDAVLGS